MVGLVVEREVDVGALLQVGVAQCHVQRVGGEGLVDQVGHGG